MGRLNPLRAISRRVKKKKEPEPTVQLLTKPDNPQTNSPLFGLPAEIRNQIFALAFTDYEDPSPDRRYNELQFHLRPSHFAPRRTDTALLYTCRAVYRECRYLPLIMTEQTHWASLVYAPPDYNISKAYRKLRASAEEMDKQVGQESASVERLKVFATMGWRVGDDVRGMLAATPGKHLKRFTVTVRHTDWEGWHNDAPLRLEGDWIRDMEWATPPSLNEVCIELETLERKKHQVHRIADMMVDRWCFKRKDGVLLYANTAESTMKVTRWRGRSDWYNHRWIRDETEEGVIDFYVLTVTFRPREVIEESGGKIGQNTGCSSDLLNLELPDDEPRIECEQPFVYVDEPWLRDDYVSPEEEDTSLPVKVAPPTMMKRATARIVKMGRAVSVRMTKRAAMS